MRTCRTSPALKTKIKKISALKKIIFDLKAQGKKIVFTNGCFDLLHYGHVKYLEDAKRKGDVLVVGINSDASLERLKGEKRPLINEGDRLRIVAGLESVDYVVTFGEDTPLKLIKAIKPNVLVKGADWDKQDIVGRNLVLNSGGKVLTIKLVKGRSSTNLIRKIVRKF